MPAPVAAFRARVRGILRRFESERRDTHDEFMSRWTLTIRTQPDELDGGFTAWVVELPGCVSDGETEKDALSNLAEAIQGVLAAELETSEPRIEVEDDHKVTTRQVAFG